MFLKRIMLMFLIIVSSLYSFNDLDYLFQKYRLRKTVETLEALKTLYPKYSEAYIKIQKLENYFMQNVPIDAYSTYVRIKLHNIIDNKLEEEKTRKEQIQAEQNILRANTDLSYLYRLKLKEVKKIKEKENKNKQTLGGTIPAAKNNSSITNPFGDLNEQQFNQIKNLLGR